MNLIKEPINVVDGIPFFSEDRYWGKASKDELESALKFLDDNGWDAFRVQYKNKFDYTFDENRADWRFVIPLADNLTVLDAGAGMGRISIPLARVAKKVVSMDHSFLRMKFLKKRAIKDGLENIEVCVGDIFDSPFFEESFDLIVMNGLLEWIGSTDRYKNPRDAQIASLKIIKSLLKKDGYVYIGIENRFAISYTRGIDHSGLRFTSYMPRWMATIYTKVRLGRRYDTYTYTKMGYENLLREAGFKNFEFYLPYPGYNLPRIMIPYENLKALAYAIYLLMPSTKLKTRLLKFLLLLPGVLYLYRFLFFSFGIVVKK